MCRDTGLNTGSGSLTGFLSGGNGKKKTAMKSGLVDDHGNFIEFWIMASDQVPGDSKVAHLTFERVT